MIEFSYFSLELYTILSYMFKFGHGQWGQFESW